MYLQNLELNQIDAVAFKAEIFNDYASTPLLTEDEIARELGENYLQAANAVTPLYYAQPEKFEAERNANLSTEQAGGSIWQRLKAFLCKVLNGASVVGDIIDAVVDFLAGIIPGGIILRGIVKKIVRYFLRWGYDGLCPV